MRDAATLMSNAQVLTATANSTDYINLKKPVNLGSGRGRPRCALRITAVTGTSPTLTAKLVGADDSAFSTNKITIGQITPTLVTGTDYGQLEIPIGSHAPKQYFRIEYTVGGSASPGGTVDASLDADYPSSYDLVSG